MARWMDDTVGTLETDAALHARARQRVVAFLEGKLLRLLTHLDAWTTAHFRCHIWHETADLEWTGGEGGAGGGVAGGAMKGWSEFVAEVAASDAVSISSNTYATTVKGCVVALVDSQVAVLQHALQEARAGSV